MIKKEKNLCFKNGKWYLDFTYNGRRYRQLVGENKTEARFLLAKYKAAARAGRLEELPGRKKPLKKDITFNEYARELLNAPRWKKKRSAWRDKISLSHLEDYFSGFKLNEITPAHAREYQTKRQQEIASNATINREITLLKSILYRAEFEGLVQANPLRGKRAEKLEEDNNRERIILEMGLSDDDLKRLIDSASERLKPILIIAITTGMRRGEILKMRWKDINIKLCSIRIPKEHSKTKEERIIPIPAELSDLIGSLPRRGEFVFQGIRDIRGAFSAACKRAGISGKLRFHDLRHIAAYHLVKVTDVMTAAKILGHRDIKTTMRYLYSTETDKRIAMQKTWENLFSSRHKVDTSGADQVKPGTADASQIMKYH